MSTAPEFIPALSEVEIARIEREVARVPYPAAAAIDALQIVQKHRGWVSDESLKAVARMLAMSPAQLDGVATFYNLIFRKPVGRHVIMYCDSVSCYVMGAPGLRAALSETLGIQPGETTADGQFTLLPIVCLGACDHAPTMMIDEDLCRDVDPKRLDEVLAKYRD